MVPPRRAPAFLTSGPALSEPPREERCWDRDLFITAGFSTPAEWFAQFGERRVIRAVVVHTMEGFLAGAIDTWNQGKSGAHLCILRDGTVVRTVHLEDVAWGAGTDQHIGRTPFWKSHNVNAYAVHIEHEGFAATGVTRAQVNACIRVGKWLKAKYGVLAEHTIDQIPGWHRHSELSNQRSDPGPLFPLDDIVAAIRNG